MIERFSEFILKYKKPLLVLVVLVVAAFPFVFT